ncbi:hypothetical protein ACJ41O_005776 [Fusarium nematophilum]
MAEYYLLRLMWRAGLLDTDKFVAAMNERLEKYYLNPTVNMTDEDAYAVARQRREAQRIPCGRGLIELANLDARLRLQSGGSQSLDILTLQMRELCKTQGSECTPSSWVELLEEHLAPSAAEEYERISSGKPLLQPIDNSLGSCFDVRQWAVKDGVNISGEGCII